MNSDITNIIITTMVPVIRRINLKHKFVQNFVLSNRGLILSRSSFMPYKPEERIPLTEHQKKLYPQKEQEFTEEGYPILKIQPSARHMFMERPKLVRKSRFAMIPLTAREQKMKEGQDWPSVWPTAKTFSPSAVPLPIRQSFESKPGKVPRGKYCNTELIKIANFLHLTPVAIKRHCKALKKFCTDWPEGLNTDEEVRKHFPVTYVTRDYIHSSPTIRDEKSRIVDIRVNIEDLKLTALDKDKLVRLAGHRYNHKTGELTIVADACPIKIQNQDYSDYLLTALYFESIKHEKWEEEKPECDWEKFFWEKSESKPKAKIYLKTLRQNIKDEVIEKGQGDPIIESYRKSLENVFENESHESLEAYRQSVENLLGVKETNIS